MSISTAVELLQQLLPDSKQLRLENWKFNATNTHLSVTVSSTQTLAQCPVCKSWNRGIHSRYQRILQDLALAQYAMTLQLHVRKFFCANSACQRRIFTERLPEVAIAWARRTNRLAQSLSTIALALGGSAGVRLSHQLGHHISHNTLLKLISRLPTPAFALPQTLGVDDERFS